VSAERSCLTRASATSWQSSSSAEALLDKDRWTRVAILNTKRCRTLHESFVGNLSLSRNHPFFCNCSAIEDIERVFETLLSLHRKTSVSKTIRKLPLAEAKTALGKQKLKYGENDFQYGGWNSFTLQCGTWLCDDMALNSPRRPLYWNSTSGFYFDHITAIDMSFCTCLRNFIQIV